MFTDYFGAYGEGSVMYHPQANSTAADVKRTQPTQYLTIGGAAAAFTDSPHSTADLFGVSSDSGIEESYHTDQVSLRSWCVLICLMLACG